MHKGEFIDYIANQQNCTKVEAEKIINTFTNAVTSILAEGKDVILIGFGKFYSSKVAARAGKNPRTGQPIKIEAYIQPKFSAGEKLKSACNGRKDSKPKTAK
ncbi:MAG: HU family DNA-binding protein [Rickettsia endosymbiont of Sergentomyia squamirostris]|uniref:HU family DNA-binding protein n=1 Tax=Candidatus Tisiphia endosymbiont of Sergentomyia squamirostris TaxID=3113639 RepID=A0AAT9G935_9RICK